MSPSLPRGLGAAFVAAVVAAGVTVALVFAMRVADAPVGDPDAAAAPEESEGVLGREETLLLARDANEVRVSYDLPDGLAGVRVTAEASGAAVDLFVSPPEAPESLSDFEVASHEPSARQDLCVTTFDHPELGETPLVVAVARPDGARAREISVRLRVTAVPRRAAATVRVGEEYGGTVSMDTCHATTIAVPVPAGTSALRIDLVAEERDLDLYAGVDEPVSDADGAAWRADCVQTCESLVLSRDEDSLAAGDTLYVTVVDRVGHAEAIAFRLLVTEGTDPPPGLLAIPTLPLPEDRRERALAAVVEVIAGEDSGSGTLVSADGLVLTAQHVVETLDDPHESPGEGLAPIVVAVTLDPRRIPRDLFRARVVAVDRDVDLALLQIVSGLHGQPLPDAYRFPSLDMAFAWEPRLGDPVYTLGFPSPAGYGTRVPVMLSRGIVSGFERAARGVRVKTDAFISGGSSGGAVLDEQFRLVGVPVLTMGDPEGKQFVGYFVPAGEVGDDWRVRFR